MEPSLSMQTSVEHQFDCFCKLTLRGEARNAYGEAKLRQTREVLFSELSQHEVEQFYTTDDYFADQSDFNVLGHNIDVKNDFLAQAINKLPEEMRNIVLLSYFLNMSDIDIATTLNLSRPTVQRKRTKALMVLKKTMEDKSNEND